MRHPKSCLALLILLALCASAALAGDPPAPAAAPAGAHEVAVYAVPRLAKGGVLKSLAKALADKPGVVAAQSDPAKKTFLVTFDKHVTNPGAILASIGTVSKDAKLVSVAPADPKAAAHDCGKCPTAKTCPGAKR